MCFYVVLRINNNISLNGVNHLVFVMEKHCVFWEVELVVLVLRSLTSFIRGMTVEEWTIRRRIKKECVYPPYYEEKSKCAIPFDSKSSFVVFQGFKNTTKHCHIYKMFIVLNVVIPLMLFFPQDLILFSVGVQIFTFSSIAFSQWPNTWTVWRTIDTVYVKIIVPRFKNKCLYLLAGLSVVIYSVYRSCVVSIDIQCVPQ